VGKGRSEAYLPREKNLRKKRGGLKNIKKEPELKKVWRKYLGKWEGEENLARNLFAFGEWVSKKTS